MGTIHLIDSLDPESKKVLNSLVQSVLVTQQRNDKNKLELIGQRRALIQAQRAMMDQKMEAEKQKFELQSVIKEHEARQSKLKVLQKECDMYQRSYTPNVRKAIKFDDDIEDNSANKSSKKRMQEF